MKQHANVHHRRRLSRSVLAAVASFGVYRAFLRSPRRVERSTSTSSSRSARCVGTLHHERNVKLVPWPSSDPLPGGFKKVEQVVDRGLIAAVVENEPLSRASSRPSRRRRAAADDSARHARRSR